MAKRKPKLEVLSAGRDVLSRRFRKLEQSLNEELNYRDRRLRFNDTPDRDGGLFWRLQNSHLADNELLSPQMSGLLAASADTTVRLEFGFTEQWSRHEGTYIFHSSNLRFAVVSESAATQPVRFRLEWAERQSDPAGGFAFTGQGAAHPHWQFDGDLRSGIFSPPAQPASPPPVPVGPVVLDVPIPEEVQDLTAALTSERAVAPGRNPLSWFHRLHLPARAQWADEECVMPDRASSQQHSPKCCDDLDRWLRSALRYLKHEFSIYAD